MSKEPKVIDLTPYVLPGDEDDDSDSAMWRTYKNYLKVKKASRADANIALMPKLAEKGKLVRYSEYHYAFQATGSDEVIDLWPTANKWRSRNRQTTKFGGVASLLRYLERKGNSNGK